MIEEKRVLHLRCVPFNMHVTATQPGGGAVQGTHRAVRTNTASVGLWCLFARGRALKEQLLTAHSLALLGTLADVHRSHKSSILFPATNSSTGGTVSCCSTLPAYQARKHG